MSETETRATTERDALASLIWTTSRADESTISATGANIVADAILRSEWLGRLTEPAATLAQMIDPIRQAFEDAGEHIECPLRCESCGERLADTLCPQCNGGGCLPNAAMAYEECDTCAGVGRIHEGCAEASYAELAAKATRLRAVVEAVQALCDQAERNPTGWGGPMVVSFARSVRAALAVSSPGEAESGEAVGDRWDGTPLYRCRSCGHLTVNEPPRSCAVCEAVAPAPVVSGGQAYGEGERYFLDAEGFMWRDVGDGMVSMARVNPDNGPIPEPRTYLVPAARPVLSREALADLLVQQTVRVQVPNVGTVTGFLRRESADHLADVLAGGEQA